MLDTLAAKEAAWAKKEATLRTAEEADQAKIKQLEATIRNLKETSAIQLANAEAQLEQYRPPQPEVEEAFAAKCLVAQPKGKLTYAAIVKRMSPTTGPTRAALKSGYWPEDDATTMVVTGLAGRIGKCRDDLATNGLPREAVINIEPLHSSYSIVTVATSMQGQVLPALERLSVEIVEPAEAAVMNIPGISEEAKTALGKRIAQRLDNRLAANFVQQRFTAGQQLRETAMRLALPIKTYQEVEKLAQSGAWHRERTVPQRDKQRLDPAPRRSCGPPRWQRQQGRRRTPSLSPPLPEVTEILMPGPAPAQAPVDALAPRDPASPSL
ncbi:hypothetical protein H4R19_001013 [Coemansia spiralis]|nr:hypothetical protein H4R19_001013 [Coemansia spiralis]